jgi:hypothetical protein
VTVSKSADRCFIGTGDFRQLPRAAVVADPGHAAWSGSLAANASHKQQPTSSPQIARCFIRGRWPRKFQCNGPGRQVLTRRRTNGGLNRCLGAASVAESPSKKPSTFRGLASSIVARRATPRCANLKAAGPRLMKVLWNKCPRANRSSTDSFEIKGREVVAKLVTAARS